jgi:hypothetical protein
MAVADIGLAEEAAGFDQPRPHAKRAFRCVQKYSPRRGRQIAVGSEIRRIRDRDLRIGSRVPLDVFGTDEFSPFVQGTSKC